MGQAMATEIIAQQQCLAGLTIIRDKPLSKVLMHFDKVSAVHGLTHVAYHGGYSGCIGDFLAEMIHFRQRKGAIHGGHGLNRFLVGFALGLYSDIQRHILERLWFRTKLLHGQQAITPTRQGLQQLLLLKWIKTVAGYQLNQHIIGDISQQSDAITNMLITHMHGFFQV